MAANSFRTWHTTALVCLVSVLPISLGCQTFTLGDSNQLRPAGQMTLDTAVANAPSHNTLSDITPSQNT
ncbi:MAG: hypothetical protein ACR2NP_16790, partial [Pirellulaceae bacterium]